MSKKKSYMNNENILAEGFFSKLRKALGLSVDVEKKLKKDKEFSNSLDDLNTSLKDFEDELNKRFRELNKLQNKKHKDVKLDKYTVKDFLKK